MYGFFVVIKASLLLGSIFLFFFLLLRGIDYLASSRIGVKFRTIWWEKVGEPVRVVIHDAKFGDRSKPTKTD